MNGNLKHLSQTKPEKPGRNLTANNGFSIIEILIAMLIFSVGILGMAAMQTYATGSNWSSMKLSGATEKAVVVLEQLKALPYNHPNLNAGTTTPGQAQDWIDNDNDGMIDEDGEDGDFIIFWTVNQNALISDTKTISVFVSSHSSNKQIVLASVISN